MATTDDITVLNSLTKIALDSRKAFRTRPKMRRAPASNKCSESLPKRRGQVAAVLQAEVRRLGGNPEDDSSFLAAAHRTFMDLKNAITGTDDRAIVEEVERGEDYIKGKYETALQDEHLSPPRSPTNLRIKPCRPTGEWAMPRSSTWSATGARHVCYGWRRSPRSSRSTISQPMASDCPAPSDWN